jgi:hypothetical protein
MSQFEKFTPAVYKRRDVKAKMELQHIDLRKTDDYGYTALMICAYANNDNILNYICENNEVIGIINKIGPDGTALDIAIKNKHENIAMTLVRHGSKVSKKQIAKMHKLEWKRIFNMDLGHSLLEVDENFLNHTMGM